MNEFNVEKVTNEIIEFIRDYYKDNKLKGVVIGISGGKDSAVVLALFVKALGSENVVALWLPIHSDNKDYQDAKKLAKKYNIELIEHDLTNIYDNYVKDIKIINNVSSYDLINANINIKPRLRMLTLYYYASFISSIKGGIYIVAGTSNKCERFVGYFTKGGDSVSDINVLSDLTVSEVIKIGEYLQIDPKIIHKTPNDGLSGVSDEEKLGVTYKDIENVLNGNDINFDIKEKINNLHNNNLHKFTIPEYRIKK